PLINPEFTITEWAPAFIEASKGGTCLSKSSISGIKAGVLSFPETGTEYPKKCFKLEATCTGLPISLLSPSYPFVISTPNSEARYTSSPKVSHILGKRGSRPRSNTGEKFHGMDEALVS